MGNSPSVPGPGGGRLHVRRDNDYVDSDRGQRPEHSQIENADVGIVEDFEEEEVDNRGDSLSVPESYVSHSCVIICRKRCDRENGVCSFWVVILRPIFFVY